MGSSRQEFAGFTNSDTNANTNSDSNSDPDANLFGDRETHQPVGQHNVQRRHESDTCGVSDKRSSEATYFQRQFKPAWDADHDTVQHGLE